MPVWKAASLLTQELGMQASQRESAVQAGIVISAMHLVPDVSTVTGLCKEQGGA